MKIMATMMALLACLLAAAACQRSTSEAERGVQEANATHPWQLVPEDYAGRIPTGQSEGNSEPGADDGRPDRPLGKGPQFLDEDTIDADRLPGLWVMVCFCQSERLDLRSNTSYNTLVLQENGMFLSTGYNEGQEVAPFDGTWRKTAPGVITLSRSNQQGQPMPNEFHSEMYGDDFLMMWDYKNHTGFWYVRQADDDPPAIVGWNRFSSDMGEITFTNVGQQSFFGELATDDGNTWQLSGYLVGGILNMAWSDARNNQDGYAAFIIEGDWDRLRGAYWKNDFEAAPFTGSWDAEAIR